MRFWHWGPLKFLNIVIYWHGKLHKDKIHTDLQKYQDVLKADFKKYLSFIKIRIPFLLFLMLLQKLSWSVIKIRPDAVDASAFWPKDHFFRERSKTVHAVNCTKIYRLWKQNMFIGSALQLVFWTKKFWEKNSGFL